MTTPDDAPTPLPLGSRATPLTIASLVSLATAGGIGGLQLAGHGDRIPAVLGTVSSWVSAGGIMGILALLVWLQLGNRRLGIDERMVHDREEADIRDHYAEEVAALRLRLDAAAARHKVESEEASARHAQGMVEIEGKYRRLLNETEEHYKRMLQESEEAHEVCKRDRDSLREELRSLRNELEGMRKQILANSSDRVIALGDPGRPPPSRPVRAAAKRVRRSLARGADKPTKA